MIRIQHEAMQHQAHEAAIATVRFDAFIRRKAAAPTEPVSA
jgi:hypothetical protein